jgi:hypothetical protein
MGKIDLRFAPALSQIRQESIENDIILPGLNPDCYPSFRHIQILQIRRSTCRELLLCALVPAGNFIFNSEQTEEEAPLDISRNKGESHRNPLEPTEQHNSPQRFLELRRTADFQYPEHRTAAAEREISSPV